MPSQPTKPEQTTNRQGSLCGCLLDAPLEKLADYLRHPEVDCIEWRIDGFLQHQPPEVFFNALRALSGTARHPLVATNRSTKEGGFFAEIEKLRLEILKRAAEWGAEWIDLEEHVGDEILSEFRATGTRILLSHHDFKATPGRSDLLRLAERMAQRNVDAVKIVSLAVSAEDNLRILEIIPFVKKEFGLEVIAFCMGQLGRWSRAASLLLGGLWAYVQLPGQERAAPGQLTARELRALLELMA